MSINSETLPNPSVETGSPPSNVLVGRQPIFDRELDIYAYELLFRGAIDMSSAEIDDGDCATSQLILNTFLEIGTEQIVGTKPAFINMTRNLLLGDAVFNLDPRQIVLEVLEDVEVDIQLIERINQLSEKGFVFALDDFIFDKKYLNLLPIIDIIKIDIMGMDEAEIRQEVEHLQPYNVKLLAEKIETHEEFELCKSLGVDYFQGFFLSKPAIVSGHRVPTNRMSILNLMQLLYEEEPRVDQIEDCISKDVSLSYRLLKNINSSYYNLNTEIKSVKHALTLLGLDKVRQWVTMVSMAKLDDKPSELVTTSLIRAKMCELLAEMEKQNNSSTYFTVGLFSNLDALLDTDMQFLLKEMPLADTIKFALLHREGALGKTLDFVMNYERGNWDAIQQHPTGSANATYAYLQALNWATETMKELSLID